MSFVSLVGEDPETFCRLHLDFSSCWLLGTIIGWLLKLLNWFVSQRFSVAVIYELQFATLTPLEPRLIKKLLPPLTNLIRTTPAMSLLYECINGIIQGGILEGTEGVREGDEIATLCVAKLREMITVEGDPNRDLPLRFGQNIH